MNVWYNNLRLVNMRHFFSRIVTVYNSFSLYFNISFSFNLIASNCIAYYAFQKVCGKLHSYQDFRYGCSCLVIILRIKESLILIRDTNLLFVHKASVLKVSFN